MKKLIFTLSLFAFHSVFSQYWTGKTYAETKREQERKAYDDNYNNANRNQRNSNLGTGGGVDKKAVEELAEQFRRNSGKASFSTNTNYSMNMKMM